MTDLPILGAALISPDLERFRDFLLELPRDLEIQDFCAPYVLDGDWRPYMEEAKRVLDGHEGRVGIHGPFMSFTIAPEDPEIRAVVTRRMHQGLDACEFLGATHMVVHSPFTTWSWFNSLKGDATETALIELCHKTMGEIVKRAEDLGCTLVVENIEDIDPYARLRLVESFESSAIALSIDTGHAHYAYGRTGAPPVDYFVRAAGKQLAHIHLQDTDSYADRHWAIGEGNIPWPSVFSALQQTGATPRLILELQDPSGLRASVEYLSRLGLAR